MVDGITDALVVNSCEADRSTVVCLCFFLHWVRSSFASSKTLDFGPDFGLIYELGLTLVLTFDLTL